MTKEEMLLLIMKFLHEESIEPHLQREILGTVAELLNHYSVEFVQDLLPSLLS
ncbi:hypothetical protein [Enterococcus sp. DIV0187]|uniref:hypothetical protein n=1 Tax=Enterococcus sp. DIV0187 TaxID=2774644 RepID=UPI003F250B34